MAFSAVLACIKGSYVSENAATACKSCEYGTYSAIDSAATACKLCTDGSSDASSSSSCTGNVNSSASQARQSFAVHGQMQYKILNVE